jgi:deferrochelatase/peroxidase EfeB
LKIENGNVIRNSDGDGIEHFGYADGISQPLFFKEEIEEYKEKYSGNLVFNPEFSLSQVLYKDPFTIMIMHTVVFLSSENWNRM